MNDSFNFRHSELFKDRCGCRKKCDSHDLGGAGYCLKLIVDRNLKFKVNKNKVKFDSWINGISPSKRGLILW